MDTLGLAEKGDFGCSLHFRRTSGGKCRAPAFTAWTIVIAHRNLVRASKLLARRRFR
jgi:hypothetical protein